MTWWRTRTNWCRYGRWVDGAHEWRRPRGVLGVWRCLHCGAKKDEGDDAA
mgnify:FL=1